MLTAVTAKAQVGFGVKGGFNFTNISNIPDDMTRTTGYGGLYMHARLERNWAIQPELLYAGMGDRYRLIPSGTAAEALDYVQIPVMFQYFPARNFYLEFGPQLGVLLGAHERYSGHSVDVSDNYNTADFDLNLGLGFRVNRTLGFNFRYVLGLTDITKNDNDTYQNRGVQLGIDLRFY